MGSANQQPSSKNRASKKKVARPNSTNPEPSTKPNDEPKRVDSAKFKNLVDVVDDKGHSKFLIKSEDEKYQLVDEYPSGAVVLQPPLQLPWLLVSASSVFLALEDKNLTARDIFDRVVRTIKSYCELPSEAYYTLCALWVMLTYRLEATNYSPMLFVIGLAELGKTRLGETLVYMAYRGMRLLSVREQHIFRFAEWFDAALFFDVKDPETAMRNAQSEDVLMSRFERGALVPRVAESDKGPGDGMRYYHVFGPTVIGANEKVNEVVESRGISIKMVRTERVFGEKPRPEHFLDIRAKLVAYRARKLGKPLPLVDRPTSGRLGDILQPIYQIAKEVDPELLKELDALVPKFEEERQLRWAETLEVEILCFVIALQDEVKNGILTNMEITERLNQGRPGNRKISPKRVANELDKLGFERCTAPSGGSAIAYDDERIVKLAKRFGLAGAIERLRAHPPEDLRQYGRIRGLGDMQVDS